MVVSELIAELQKYDGDAVVMWSGSVDYETVDYVVPARYDRRDPDKPKLTEVHLS